MLSAMFRSQAHNRATDDMFRQLGDWGQTAAGYQANAGGRTGIGSQFMGLGNQMVQRAQAEQAARERAAKMLIGAGDHERGQRQRQLDEEYRNWYGQTRGRDIEDLNLLLSSIGSVPYNQSQTHTQDRDPISDLLGLTQIGAGLFG